jgi:ubiquinone/menaquinone biosynthesis C-methylase UbiE
MIAKARKKFTPIDLINGNVIELPFKHNIFDGLYIIQVLHHINDKLAFFKEGMRVLKHNGHLAIHTCSHKQLKSVWYYHYFKEGLKKD